jgi:hypothetical protein
VAVLLGLKREGLGVVQDAFWDQLMASTSRGLAWF